eukprot:TRINITY_DN7248_c0_g1_i3.p1 TRINITY_DN7248_c0_g1~~TRINITY_DN7248_c0_g1_i3.p1  ORF type:complete len:650 (-),score=225.62 TRINITY_DN7248_c0_g1_i3:23-1972(-)
MSKTSISPYELHVGERHIWKTGDSVLGAVRDVYRGIREHFSQEAECEFFVELNPDNESPHEWLVIARVFGDRGTEQVEIVDELNIPTDTYRKVHGVYSDGEEAGNVGDHLRPYNAKKAEWKPLTNLDMWQRYFPFACVEPLSVEQSVMGEVSLSTEYGRALQVQSYEPNTMEELIVNGYDFDVEYWTPLQQYMQTWEARMLQFTLMVAENMKEDNPRHKRRDNLVHLLFEKDQLKDSYLASLMQNVRDDQGLLEVRLKKWSSNHLGPYIPSEFVGTGESRQSVSLSSGAPKKLPTFAYKALQQRANNEVEEVLKQWNEMALAPNCYNQATISSVQLDGGVLLRIMKHYAETSMATGNLVGMDAEEVLEVTNCFPFPDELFQAEDSTELDEYSYDMMRALREVNVDYIQVGWYQCNVLSDFFSEATLQHQAAIQEELPNAVAIVFDPVQALKGTLSVHAYRLTDTFLDVYRHDVFTQSKLNAKKIGNNDVFEELPVEIYNSELVKALLLEVQDIEEETSMFNFEALTVESDDFMKQKLEDVMSKMDLLSNEQNRFQYYQKQINRQQQSQAQAITKFKQENATRRQQGAQPLSEEDLLNNNPVFKPIAEPSSLDALLVSNQINEYCNQINQYSGDRLSKLFLTRGLQQSNE